MAKNKKSYKRNTSTAKFNAICIGVRRNRESAIALSRLRLAPETNANSITKFHCSFYRISFITSFITFLFLAIDR